MTLNIFKTYGRLTILCAIVLFSCFLNAANAQTVYFLAGGIYPSTTESYVVPLDDPADIAHARNLIEYGHQYGPCLIAAAINRWDPNNGINPNRDYTVPGIPAWSWYITEFQGFADYTIEILDGNPSWVEDDIDWWIGDYTGAIGFWSYTIVAELGTDPTPWNCDLTVDGIVDNSDLASIASHWLFTDCAHRFYCGGTDLNGSGEVDFVDFAIFASNWLWQE